MKKMASLPSELKRRCAELRSKGKSLQEELERRMINRDITQESDYKMIESQLIELNDTEKSLMQ